MMGKLMRAAAVAAAAVAVAHGVARATVLTFDVDPPVTNFQAISQSYGDNVTTTNDVVNNYQYGNNGEGFTPNITADYGPAGAAPALWTTDYGDLTNILFKDADGFATLRVTLTAEAGYVVRLHSFDMAAYNPVFSAPPTINYIRVLDSGGGELFRQDNAVISETAHTPFDFSAAPLTDDVIVIEFDSINLGGLSDDIALDNIVFSQIIPEPATAGLMVMLGGAGMLRRRGPAIVRSRL